MNHGDSRKLKSVPSKSRPVSSRARAPARSAGRKGRTPLAPESPAPWPMSMNRLIAQLRCGRRMTIDDELRPMARGPSTTRDLERYAGLFASRTRGMKSSAMRDLMAVIARPEVISLAGGLPDTGAFPADTFAAVAARVAQESTAEALQYGPTEGLAKTRE